jgi:hypothetical protein
VAEEDLGQSSVSQKSQTDSNRLLDLETQLSDLKASNSDLQLSLSSREAEIAELKKALAAAHSVQNPQ